MIFLRIYLREILGYQFKTCTLAINKTKKTKDIHSLVMNWLSLLSQKSTMKWH